jgi:hypothetical protein
MSAYKKAALELLDHLIKKFISKNKTIDFESQAAEVFAKFKYQIKESDEMEIMFILLKIMVVEGVMLNGTRRLNSHKSDA